MEPRLRVLAVTNTYPTEEQPDDAPYIKDQIVALRALGVSVDVLHIHRQKGKSTYLRVAWRLFQQSFQGDRYDLIHAYYGHCGLLARLQFRYPVVVTFRGSDLLSRRDGAIGRCVARLADGIIVMSEEMKSVAKRSDASVIPFGVDLDLFAPQPVQDARDELKLPPAEKLVLFPWNPARPVKRFDLVEEAVRMVRKKQDRVRLVAVYGEPHATVAKYMSACDVMVLASEHEGSPVAVREAMACGLPIVSVDVGDVHQIIANVEGCFLCKREASDIAEKVGEALSWGHRTDGLRKVKAAGASWAAEQVLEVYDSVLHKRWRRRNAGKG
jgi:teichuronic acid biosynthesis glycosyltransferase TuaC